jgi:cytochrome c oxidase cbb3-type subunit 3
MNMRTSLVLYLALTWLVIMPLAQDKEPENKIKNPFRKDKTAAEAGRAQFNSGCAVCHGPTGQGGRGSRLAEVERVQKMSDGKMFNIIKEGVAGTQMPPFSSPDEQIWRLVSFIRSLNASAVDQEVPGNSAVGESLFYGKCSECHMIRGRGGLMGPDLSNVGARRSLEKIRQAIREPDAFIEPGYAHVSVVTQAGQRISGTAKNNSNYSIQIQDAQGKFHFLSKRNLREVVHHSGSLMPKLSLSDVELQNLLAFLSRQSLAPPETAEKIEPGKEAEP